MSMSATLSNWPLKAYDPLGCPARAFYHEMLLVMRGAHHGPDVLLFKAKEILQEEFGDKSVSQLHTDELKWFNGKLLRLLKEEGLVQ